MSNDAPSLRESPSEEAVVSALVAAFESAERGLGYSISLHQLIDGIETRRLKIGGEVFFYTDDESNDFDANQACYDHLARVRHQVRVEAVREFLKAARKDAPSPQKDPTMTEKLKPCPMCSARAVVRRRENGLFFVTCGSCGVRTIDMHYEPLALTAWNTRPSVEWRLYDNATALKNGEVSERRILPSVDREGVKALVMRAVFSAPSAASDAEGISEQIGRIADEAADAILSLMGEGGVPEGFKLVPVEPTRQMWAASGDVVVKLQARRVANHDAISEAVWSAMLLASQEG